MFTSCTDDDVKKQILHSFSVPSKLRIVIATSSFGMGIDCPDIREIVHLGAPADLETYIQETGRGGRDGNITFAKLLTVNRQNRFCEQSMLGYQKNTSMCRRDLLFRDTDHYEHMDMGKKCLCCDICAVTCDCGVCELTQMYIL